MQDESRPVKKTDPIAIATEYNDGGTFEQLRDDVQALEKVVTAICGVLTRDQLYAVCESLCECTPYVYERFRRVELTK